MIIKNSFEWLTGYLYIHGTIYMYVLNAFNP